MTGVGVSVTGVGGTGSVSDAGGTGSVSGVGGTGPVSDAGGTGSVSGVGGTGPVVGVPGSEGGAVTGVGASVTGVGGTGSVSDAGGTGSVSGVGGTGPSLGVPGSEEGANKTVSSGEASGTTTEEDLTTVVFNTTTTETPAEPTTPEEIDSAATTASVSPTIYNIFEVNGVMTSGKLAYSADLADNSTVAYISAGLTFCRNLKAALKHKLRNIGCEVTGFAQDAANSRRRRRRRSTTYKTDVSYTNSVVSSADTNTDFGTEYAAALADPVTAARFVDQGFTSKSVAISVKSSQTVQAGTCVTFKGQSVGWRCGGAGSNMFGALILLAFGRYFL